MPGIAFAVTASLAALVGCEKVSHENIDRWENTEKGGAKLRSALGGEHDPDLRAHAAQILIRTHELDYVLQTLGDIEPRDRSKILAPLVERLWRDAQLEGELARPQPHHVVAKDALFDLRPLASPDLRRAIDTYLISWLTGGYFEGRSKSGRYSGKRIARAVGPAAGENLVTRAREVLARPPDASGNRVRLGDELLGALAYSADSNALNLLLDLIEKPQVDPTLSSRAAAALRDAYIASSTIDTAPGRALAPVARRLEAIASNESTPAGIADIAIGLLAATGMPGCLPPFVEIVARHHQNPSFRWAGVQNGIRCAGVAGIVPIVEALPPRGTYPEALLDKYLWKEIASLPDKKAVATQARRLLSSDSWIAKVTAVELLGKLRIRGHALRDAERVEKLATDRTRLRGWYPKSARKPDPTLGQVAAQVGRRLREVAQPTKSK